MMYRLFFKRFLDILVATLGLLMLSPLFVVLIVVLSILNNYQPFFSQQRPGKNERLFKLIKFKTMNDKTDRSGNLLADTDRLTKVGKLIRKTSMDEIPQLLNVLFGDMSLIGPRPLLVKYLP